jgi:hypothetical protein
MCKSSKINFVSVFVDDEIGSDNLRYWLMGHELKSGNISKELNSFPQSSKGCESAQTLYII